MIYLLLMFHDNAGIIIFIPLFGLTSTIAPLPKGKVREHIFMRVDKYVTKMFK